MGIFSAGSASVNIVPDFSGAQKAIGEFFARQSDVKVKVSPDLANGDVARTEAELNAMHGKAEVEVDRNFLTSSVQGALAEAMSRSGLDKLGGLLSSAIKPTLITAIGGAFVELAAAASQAVGILALAPAALSAIAVPAGVVAIGVHGIGAAFKALDTGNAQKIAEAMSKLAPAAQDLVTQVHALGPAWTSLRLDVQQSLFNGVGTAVTNLAGVALPILHTGLVNIAGAMNSGLLATMTALQGQGANFTTLFSNIASTIRVASGAAAPLIQAFLTLAAVGSQFLPQLAAGFVTVATKFNDWVQHMAATGQLVTIIQNAINVLKELGQLAGNVAGIVLGVFSAALPFGNLLLQMLVKLTGSLSTFVHSADAQSALQDFFSGITTAMGILLPALGTLVEAIVKYVLPAIGQFAALLAPIAGQLLTQLAGALKAVAGILPPVVQVMANLFNAMAPLIPVISEIITTLLPPLVSFFGQLAPIIGQVATILGGALLQAAKAIAPVLPIIGKAVIDILNAVLPLLQPLASIALQLLPPLASALGVLAGFVAGVVQALAPFVKAVLDIVAVTALPFMVGLINSFTAGLKVLSPILTPLAGIILAIWGAVKLWTAAQALLDIALDANPIGALVLAIGLLIAAIGFVVTHIGELKSAIGTALGFIENLWNTVWGAVSSFVVRIWTDITTFLKGIWTSITGFFASQFNTVLSFWENIWNTCFAFVERIWNDISSFFVRIWNDITGFFSTQFNNFRTVWDNNWNLVSQGFQRIWNDISTFFQRIWGDITGFFTRIWTQFSNYFTTQLNQISALWDRVWTDISNFFVRIWNDISGFFVRIWNSILSFFTGQLNTANNVWTTTWNAVSSFFVRIWNDISNFFQRIWGDISSWFAQRLAAFTQAWNQGWSAISQFFVTIWNNISTFFQRIWGDISSWFSQRLAAFIQAWNQGWSSISQFFVRIWTDISNFFQRIWTDISTWFSQRLTAFTSVFVGAWNNISNAVTGIFNGMIAAIRTAWDQLVGVVEQPIKSVVNVAVNGFIRGVDDLMSFLHLPWKIPLVNLGFAEGGYTGNGIFGGGGKYEPAGVVHAREFVVNQEQTAKHLPLLQAINSGASGYAGGGLVGQIVGLFNDPAGTLVNYMKGLLGSGAGSGPFGDMINQIPIQMAQNMGSWIGKEVKDGISAALKAGGSLASSITGALGGALGTITGALGIVSGGASAPNIIIPSSRAANVAAVNLAAAAYGWNTGAMWNDLVAVINRESGFNNTAQNPTSTAFGMFQFLNSTWAGFPYGKTSDPLKQAIDGMLYVKQRYGSPAGALAHEQAFGWYDQGGWLAPGASTVYNGTGGFEAVLNQAQQAAITGALSGSGDAVPVWHFYLGDKEITDMIDSRVTYHNARDGRTIRSSQ